jgi:hypothetical protein
MINLRWLCDDFFLNPWNNQVAISAPLIIISAPLIILIIFASLWFIWVD